MPTNIQANGQVYRQHTEECGSAENFDPVPHPFNPVAKSTRLTISLMGCVMPHLIVSQNLQDARCQRAGMGRTGSGPSAARDGGCEPPGMGLRRVLNRFYPSRLSAYEAPSSVP